MVPALLIELDIIVCLPLFSKGSVELSHFRNKKIKSKLKV